MIKKLLSFSFLSFFAFASVNAQTSQVPNGDFESWSGQNATGWNNLNGVAPGSCTKATASADIHGGSAAIILTTLSVFGQNAPGTAATGTINLLQQTITGGVPFTDRPDSLVGWYKYAPVGNDGGNIVAILFNANRDTIAVAPFFPSGTVNNYTYFKTAFQYRLPDTPTEALFILASSGTSGSQVNTKMYVDDLAVVYDDGTVSLADILAKNKIALYPNPASDKLFINITGTQNASVSIFDITGKKVAQHQLGEKVNNINITSLAGGMYVYQVTDENNSVLKTDKFIVK